ncbi:MAG TPA: hypothetical protein VJT81_16600 [Burkholderiales bacterium]|nr:hypothetical protein [Burkholderiales bacterium]
MDTNQIDSVFLASLLPVLTGRAGNTGCEARGVTLRGTTLGELRTGSDRAMFPGLADVFARR